MVGKGATWCNMLNRAIVSVGNTNSHRQTLQLYLPVMLGGFQMVWLPVVSTDWLCCKVGLTDTTFVLRCRPDTPDASSDHTPRIASSSGRSSMLSHDFPDSEPNASAPFSDSQSVQTPSANPSTAPNPFAAAALIRAGWEDSEAESEFSTPRSSFDRQDPRHSSSHGSSSRTARAVPKSPRSPSRAHAQQPLDESEGGKLLLAKLSMMERTHSAPGTALTSMLSCCMSSCRRSDDSSMRNHNFDLHTCAHGTLHGTHTWLGHWGDYTCKVVFCQAL